MYRLQEVLFFMIEALISQGHNRNRQIKNPIIEKILV